VIGGWCLDIDDGSTAAAVFVVGWGPVAPAKFYAGAAGSGQLIEGDTDDANDESAEQGVAESLDMEGFDQSGDEEQEERVDDPSEEAESEEAEDDFEGAEDSIKDAEQKGGEKQVVPLVIGDAFDDERGEEHCDGADQPAFQEFFEPRGH